MERENKEFAAELRERIYRWVCELISFLDTVPKTDDVVRVIRMQLLRSGTSVGANYFEAIAGSSRKDFANFLNHALKSCNESKFWLYLLRDTKKGERQAIEKNLGELEELARLFGASVRTLRKKQQ